MATHYAEPFDVQMTRVADIVLSSDKQAKPKRGTADVRACLASGGSVTFRLLSADAVALKGTSDNFGGFSIPLAACEKLEIKLPAVEEVKDAKDGADKKTE